MAGAQDGMCLESRYAFYSNSFLLYTRLYYMYYYYFIILNKAF